MSDVPRRLTEDEMIRIHNTALESWDNVRDMFHTVGLEIQEIITLNDQMKLNQNSRENRKTGRKGSETVDIKALGLKIQKAIDYYNLMKANVEKKVISEIEKANQEKVEIETKLKLDSDKNTKVDGIISEIFKLDINPNTIHQNRIDPFHVMCQGKRVFRPVFGTYQLNKPYHEQDISISYSMGEEPSDKMIDVNTIESMRKQIKDLFKDEDSEINYLSEDSFEIVPSEGDSKMEEVD